MRAQAAEAAKLAARGLGTTWTDGSLVTSGGKSLDDDYAE
jgi:hypothetical protein